MSKPARIGVIGCGNISPQYFKGAKLYPQIRMEACSDLSADVAKSRAEEFDVPRVLTVDELIADPEIDIVLNLTTPQFHAAINTRILEAGKHAYCEKPFATSREEGRAVLELAKRKGLRVGCAPDTFLSSPMQTARKLVDDGVIGRVFGGTAVFACPGHERWHPNPEFYYKQGGGPVLDMAPYYFTVLANLLGPAVSVVSSGKRVFTERKIATGPNEGQRVEVETATHNNSLVEYASGACVNAMFSFDVQGAHDLPLLTLYGSEGNLSLPDPNCFDGVVRVCRPGGEWEEMSLLHNYEGARALGLAELADAIRNEREHRANGELAFHVFDTMLACEEAAASGSRVSIDSSFERLPALLGSDSKSPKF
ncbi:Gfo/Idh/MocA family protein [Pelagicoccus albus]|uniref:Gfo/Idh/MocA family oxidoreductase n=1 Tax=Pelagicoccus albus TaxID=415222 RepID=A0A7X1EAL9_9BACT|nr:Gfo/Idh/MocA family oxidoreductase [Pelagicoccus albus]MBC2606907.1 Gfo/Idh/MocA family oxidoreductase [Pelagicoccus albus]